VEPDHVTKRETRAGRAVPALFYALNVVLWIVTALASGALDRLWLVVLPLIPLALYAARAWRRS
jgi:hypothetical protein